MFHVCICIVFVKWHVQLQVLSWCPDDQLAALQIQAHHCQLCLEKMENNMGYSLF